MANTFPPKLTVLEKLDLIPANISLVATAIYAAITGIFRGQKGAKSYMKHINYAVIRKMLQRLSTRQNQATNPSTSGAYEIFARQNKIEAQTVQLNYGGLGHWLGNKDAKNVLVYYHGGGFAISAGTAYFQVLKGIMEELNAAGKDIAIFVLTYTLAPHAVYPTQVKQAVEALRHVIQAGHDPSNVVIGGDSAGGNLTLAVLSHISHPHKDIKPLEISCPLAGAFTIAPWVSFSQDFPSVKENALKDIIMPELAERWSSSYLAGQETDNYNQPLLAPAEWWKDIKARDLLIVAGSDEILLSCIEEFVEKLKSVLPNVTYIVGQDEPHVAPFIYLMLGDKSTTQQDGGLRTWLSSRL
ncbi:alpha/beta hydrolase fold protein [Coccidioides immitis RS]|uniref:Alpha/beta hydrolase fold protein n=3 Tax=Coccidioides immitis TaxID=5501 RepID=J3K700_COCIM|nr:alpha/beta hydrolase fold protein [Coccidioides immitis RS]EAS30408.3 alpha/beta hydrolase fold protein [Coccidioides immitis RS]KMP02951.1 hypothetical protein CIRG_02643 [Coccidioides immitis RMSCC 2394]KMU77394.1 hypothetical protein CISG_06641 [Coccidioides immitis RMSCC 3703]TPX23375.1 hypothetical protein DIZ76_012705 [Coccidioides immitis]